MKSKQRHDGGSYRRMKTMITTVINNTVSTTATPAFAGTGALVDVALLYISTGVGGATTLNGGLGPISLPMSSIKIRPSALVPAGQIAAGQNTGAFEFDGTDLYFTEGTTRSKVFVSNSQVFAALAEIASASPGDLFYLDGDGALARLPAGENGQTLQIADGMPAWATV